MTATTTTGKPFAVCVYTKPEAAAKAVRELNDTLNWRGGLRVTGHKPGKAAKTPVTPSGDARKGLGDDQGEVRVQCLHAGTYTT
jgi:hypothetical protein